MKDYGVCKTAYGIGNMPGRKGIALYRSGDAYVRVLAYFKNEEDAREFMDFVDRLARLTNEGAPDPEWHGWAVVQK